LCELKNILRLEHVVPDLRAAEATDPKVGTAAMGGVEEEIYSELAPVSVPTRRNMIYVTFT
jgi:hypothetical protein